MMTVETPQGSAGQLSWRHEDQQTRARDKSMHHALGSETPSNADVFFRHASCQWGSGGC
jgi:hypothetical protein